MAPGLQPGRADPLSYDDGWLSLMARTRRCLMVEDGWDRLAQTFAGFHGGLLAASASHRRPNEN